jgi:catechol 2,3-dioxygenase-like lactoylglutathione lyase family enzyme
VVSDLEESKNFYGDILGLMPSHNKRPTDDLGFDGAWFQISKGQELHLVERPKEEDKELEYRNNHFALRVGDITKTEARLKSKGAKPKRFPTLLTGFPQLYLLDPDGHVIEINSAK